MVQVPIGAVQYDVYANVATADAYLAGDVSRYAAWSALDADGKGRALVSGTRWIDRITWKGTKTVPSQVLQWPRTGVTDCQGNAVDSATVPAEIINASILLAGDLTLDPTLSESRTADGSNIQALVAGPAEIRFFRAVPGTLLPTAAFRMIQCLLFGASIGLVGMGGYRSGEDEYSEICDDRNSLGQGYT